jgi:hypothetical protein
MPEFVSKKVIDGDWFTWCESTVDEKGNVVYADPKHDEKGRVRVRSIMPFMQERTSQRKKEYEFVLNPETRAMERIGYFKDLTPEEVKKEQEDLWDYAITGIENFVLDGQPVSCDREGKNKLMALPEFDRFIGQCLRLLASTSAQKVEEERKNSESTQDAS